MRFLRRSVGGGAALPDPELKGLLFDTPCGPMAILWSRKDGYTLTGAPVIVRGIDAARLETPKE